MVEDAEITRMLTESYEHAKGDMEARALREQQVEAERVIEALVSALAADGKALLSDAEYTELEAAIESLRTAHNQSTAQDIAAEIERVGALSEDFAARRMNASINQALSGHSLDELDAEGPVNRGCSED